MTKKYILTGGPGSGKSSTLLELESRGEYIIREAAEDIIKIQLAQGIEKPWEYEDFQLRILNLQIQRENKIPKNIERVFIDRGIPDGLAYTDPTTTTYKKILTKTPPYHGIFLIENLGHTQTNETRREDQSESLNLERKLDSIYKNLGYDLQKIAPSTIKERVDRILQIITSEEKLI